MKRLSAEVKDSSELGKNSLGVEKESSGVRRRPVEVKESSGVKRRPEKVADPEESSVGGPPVAGRPGKVENPEESSVGGPPPAGRQGWVEKEPTEEEGSLQERPAGGNLGSLRAQEVSKNWVERIGQSKEE